MLFCFGVCRGGKFKVRKVPNPLEAQVMNASNTASRAMLVALFVSVIGFHVPTARAADKIAKVYDKPSFLSEYDIATRDDLRLSYHIRPLVSGDLAEGWPILEGVEDQLGDWVTQFISAPRIEVYPILWTV